MVLLCFEVFGYVKYEGMKKGGGWFFCSVRFFFFLFFLACIRGELLRQVLQLQRVLL